MNKARKKTENGKRKPNCEVWLSWVSYPMHRYMQKNSTFLWPPRFIFAVACHGQKLVPILRHVIRHVASMWAGHVSSPLRWSLHSVAVGFAILCSQRWILVNLNASTIAFIEVWGNCPCLFYMLTSTTLNRLSFGNRYILIAFVA